MTEYITEIQRQLVETYGYKKGDNGCPQNVPDGAYPMLIEKKLDLVMVVNGHIWCCNFINDKGGLKEFQKKARGQYAKKPNDKLTPLPPTKRTDMPKAKLKSKTTSNRPAQRRLRVQIVVQPLAWKWAGHMSGNRCVTKYRCEQYGANAEKWCNRREGNGPMGYEYYGGGTIFYLDGDKREYKTQKQLIAAIEKRLNTRISDRTIENENSAKQ